jgi:type II secretory pathway component PulJ
VSLNLPVRIPALITMAKGIIAALTGNTATFPSPDPSLAALSAALTDLETAESSVQARTRGAVAGRNEKRKELVTLLEQLKAYVQKVADANSETSAQTIQSIGLAVRKNALRQKQTFAAKTGPISGTIDLTAAVTARRASYEWQSSLDGGKTWTSLPTTIQSKTTVSGLTPGVTATFRSRTVTQTGEGDWTQATAIVVK